MTPSICWLAELDATSRIFSADLLTRCVYSCCIREDAMAPTATVTTEPPTPILDERNSDVTADSAEPMATGMLMAGSFFFGGSACTAAGATP